MVIEMLGDLGDLFVCLFPCSLFFQMYWEEYQYKTYGLKPFKCNPQICIYIHASHCTDDRKTTKLPSAPDFVFILDMCKRR